MGARGGPPFGEPILLLAEVASPVQEPVVLGSLARGRIGRALAEPDVGAAGLEAIERVEDPDASRGVDLCGTRSAVADAPGANAAGIELVGDARIHPVAVPWDGRLSGRGEVEGRSHALPDQLYLLRGGVVGLRVRAHGAHVL